jgi:transposase
VARLIGEGIEAEHLNDDMLGRALDAIYGYGPDILYPQVAAQAVKHLGLLCRFENDDSTGIHTDGQYNSGEEPENGVIHITKGYSRDHRPDLNQVVEINGNKWGQSKIQSNCLLLKYFKSVSKSLIY